MIGFLPNDRSQCDYIDLRENLQVDLLKTRKEKSSERSPGRIPHPLLCPWKGVSQMEIGLDFEVGTQPSFSHTQTY